MAAIVRSVGHDKILLRLILLLSDLFFASVPGQLPASMLVAQSSVSKTDAVQTLERLIDQKQWKEAVELGRTLATKLPDNSTLRYRLGMALFQLGDTVSAIQALRSAEQLGLHSADLHKVLGFAYYDYRQFVLFEQQIQKAIVSDPADYELYYSLGRYYEAVKKDFSQALDLFVKAVRANPRDPKSFYHRGYCKEMLGQVDLAREDYQTAIRLLEKSGERLSEPYRGMARLLLDSEPRQALQWAQKAVNTNSGNVENYRTLAKVNERLAQSEQAITTLLKVIQLDSTDSSAHYRLYRLYESAGNQQAAEQMLNRFKELAAVYGPP